MGITLDQLLSETGASNLGGRAHAKTASAAEPNFSKLAERCRRAADAPPEEDAEATRLQLAEKTAAVEIIRRTIAEISAIGGGQEKTAAAPAAAVDPAIFIKAALEAGHAPEAIAAFLEKQGGEGRVGRFVGEAVAGLKSGRAERAGAKADKLARGAVGEWMNRARQYAGAGDEEKAKFVDKLRTKFGDKGAAKILENRPDFHHLPGVQEIMPKPGAAEAGKKAVGVNIGGTQLGLTGEQLDKVKKPAMYLGAGLLAHRALGGSAPPEKKKSGVVVVNS